MTSKDRATEIAALLSHLAELLTDQSRVEASQPRPMPPRTLLTVEEAAELLHIGKTKAYALVKAGELESVRIGRLRRIHIDAVNSYASQLTERQNAKPQSLD